MRNPCCAIRLMLAPLLLAAVACSAPVRDTPEEVALWEEASVYFEPLPAVAVNPENEATPAKVALGKALYFDPRLSQSGTVSCNACHNLASFGVDNLPKSPGDEGQLGGRNSPTVLNAALHGAQFWDGRAEDLEEQAGMPILNPVEMAIPSEEFLVERLSAISMYEQKFAEAFPGHEQPLTFENISRALAAFERTLLTPSRFDAYLEGDRDALSDQEKEGLRHFMSMGCVQCHDGVNVGASSFHKFGLFADYWEHTNSESIDEGRFELTEDPDDRYVFRVASLRNVEKTAPYFHDGSVEQLDEAIRIMIETQIGPESAAEPAAAITAFLRSLTGDVPEEALLQEG